jgi:hypothetical protein
MAMSEIDLKLVNKYALILAATYLLEFIVNKTMRMLYFEIMSEPSWLNFIHQVFPFVLNLISAVMVSRDSKVFGIKTRYVVMSTIIYRPVGVVMFLLYLIYGKNEKVQGN